MKHAWLSLILLLPGQSMAWADCPPGTYTRAIGTAQSSNAGSGDRSISQAGALVSTLVVSCGGTACVATLYDSDGSGGAAGANSNGDAQVRAEPGAPANQSVAYTYDPPLYFAEGVSFHDDGNVNGIIAFRCS